MKIVRTKSKIGASAYLVDDDECIQRDRKGDATGAAIRSVILIIFSIIAIIMMITNIVA